MRLLTPKDRSLFELPHAIGCILLLANVAAYGLCLDRSGALEIPADVLFRAGAMYPLAIERREYWRLVAYGFLHADLLHLAANMICLILWGGHLEKRIGPLYFLLIYVCALVVAGVVGPFLRAGGDLAVGASGAVSGVMGALLCLWLLGKSDLPATFLVINVGLNVALALAASRIGWGAHLAGFGAGLIACGLLDLLERMNARVLRCKFPEFVKMNGFVAVGVLTIYLFERAPAALLSRGQVWMPVLAYVIGCAVLVKLLDLILSMRKGLAVVVVMLAAANAAIVLFVADALFPTLASKCRTWWPAAINEIDKLIGMMCANLSITIDLGAVCIFALTLLAYRSVLRRGLKDVGFVGNTLRAERQRHQGI